MPQSCCAYNCTNRARVKVEGENPVSFHSFPKDKTLLKKWLIAMKRHRWVPQNHSRICSDHFSPDAYKTRNGSNMPRLKQNAVPTKFQFPKHLQKTEIRPRKSPAKRKQNTEIASDFSPSEGHNENSAEIVNVPEPKKMRLTYLGDFKKQDVEVTVQNLPLYTSIAEKALEKKKKQIRLLQQKNYRLSKRLTTLESLVSDLQEKNLATDEIVQTIMDSVPVPLRKSFMNQFKGKKSMKYPPELRTFALTLDFYSPKAYDYVREVFNGALPHRRTIQKWYETVECEPGFNQEALKTLQRKSKNSDKTLVCGLMIDEMSIRKHLHWDGHQFVGYVNYGSYSTKNDGSTLAKDVLVFMLNCLNERWKLPIGYFFIASLGAIQKANLINACLNFLKDSGVKIISLTFDGARTNMSMCRYLGCSFADAKNLKTSFCNPHSEENEEIFIFFDPPHALKLVRNALGSYKILLDGENKEIKWSDFENLVNIQLKEKLHLGCKVTKRHVQWQREKMKVKLAAQTFSRSSADAMKYLRLAEDIPIKTDSAATEKFFIAINNIFDIMNSRNILGKYYKQGLQRSNETFIFTEMIRIKNYILELKDASGLPICQSERKTGFLGFLICIESLISMFSEMVLKKRYLSFILTYKMSQDHLEVFFCALRSRNGHNNNPSAHKFKAAYKRLLIHTAVKGNTGNCVELEETPISILFSSSKKSSGVENFIPKAILNAQTSRKHDAESIEKLVRENENLEKIFLEHSYAFKDSATVLSTFVEDVVGYAAGFIIRKLEKKVLCLECYQALKSEDTFSFLQKMKSYTTNTSRGLFKASKEMINLCRLAEAKFRQFENNFKNIKNPMEFLIMKTLNELQSGPFKVLDRHAKETSATENHPYFLAKIVLYEFFKIRLHYYASLINEIVINLRVRSINTKSVTFQNQ